MDRNDKIKTYYNVAVVAGVISLVAGFLLLFNYLQMSGTDPVESKALDALVERLDDEPGNSQLKEEIRNLDLMARKAYFTAKWQIQTGGWILLFSAVLLIVALRNYFLLTNKIEEPEKNPVSENASRVISSRWVLLAGLIIICTAFLASFLSVDYLSRYETIGDKATQQGGTSVEVVDLTEGSEETEPETEAEISEEAGVVTEDAVPEVVEADEQEAVVPDSKEQENTTEVAEVKEEKEVVDQPKSSAPDFPSKSTIESQFNSFRGAWGNGISKAENLPLKWDVATGTNVMWTADIPISGYSSPVVWDNLIFVTGGNQQERRVFCYNAASGKLLWNNLVDNIEGSPSTPPETTEDTGLAAPTSVTDGNVVVSIFGTGDIIAFTMEGERVWARNLGVPDNHYGHSSSLMAYDGKVLVQYDTNKSGRLLALNMYTGETVWDVSRDNRISWASPILAEVDGEMQVVTSTTPKVAGHSVKTGEELWAVECMMGEVGPSPAYANGLVIAGNEYAILAAIDPTKGETVWESYDYLPEVASPVVADGLLFIATTYGVFACYDVHTGNKYWEMEFDEGFYASPVIGDGKLYAPDMQGVVHVIAIDREGKKLAANEMGERIVTTPALLDNRIYIRSDNKLYCIGE
ncbi:MAG: PQQ-binding-like beta-propeller repeat protein [Prolixibacteraceae bacterium]|nr:PQQ-binding-like beta-propeller repeat protein [Prolixibacteraceae bacterium]